MVRNEDEYRFGGDVKEARPPAASVIVVQPEKILLSMASNLSRCS